MYERTNEVTYLLRSIAHFLKAVELSKLSDPVAPELVAVHHIRRRLSWQRAYERDATKSNALLIGGAYIAACETGLEVGLEWALAAALRWGDWALGCRRWMSRREGTDTDWMQSISSSVDSSVGTSRKRGSPGCAGCWTAAYAMAQAGEGAEAAMAIQRGRWAILSEVLERDRADLSALEESGRPDLADRYRKVSAAVRVANTVLAARGARDDLEHAILAIRQVAGFEDFLAKPRHLNPEERALVGPVVYLAAAPTGGTAVLSDSALSSPEVVHLEMLTESTVNTQIQALMAAYARRQLSGSLGGHARRSDFMAMDLSDHPLLSTLSNASEATFVPAGRLGLLPLHAAWTGDPDAHRDGGTRWTESRSATPRMRVAPRRAPDCRRIVRAKKCSCDRQSAACESGPGACG